MAENVYSIKVVSDWSQPEKAVRDYAKNARAVIASIQQAAASGSARPGVTQQRLRGAAESISSTRAGLDVQRQATARSGGDTSALDRQYAELTKELKRVTRESRELAKRTQRANPTAISKELQSAKERGAAAGRREAQASLRAARATELQNQRKKKADNAQAAADQKLRKAKEDAARSHREAGLRAARSRLANIQRFGTPSPSQEQRDRTRAIEQDRRQAAIDRARLDSETPEGQAFRERVDAQFERSRLKREMSQADKARRLQREGTPGTRENRAVVEAALLDAQVNAVKQRQLKELEFQAVREGTITREQAKEIILENQIQEAKRRQLRNEFRQAELSGQLPRPTLYQRFASRINDRPGATPRPASQEQKFGQAIGGRFATTAQFALSGALLYGGQQFIREMVTEASELQSTLSLVRGQIESTGTEGAAQYEGFKNSIIETSKETGVMATQLAEVGRRLLGIFRIQDEEGKDLGPDFAAVQRNLEVAGQFSQITGVDPKQITDELVGVYKSFENATGAEVSFSKLQNDIISVAQDAGVAESEILDMTASLAPLASTLGFTSQELTGFSAAAIATSGKDAATLGENFGRVLTDLSSKRGEVFKFYSQIPELAEKIPNLSEMFAEGDIQGAIFQILGDWDTMTVQMRQQFAEQVFGRREAQSIISVFNDGQRALELAESETDPQAAAKRIANRQKTVAYALEEFEREFEELGAALYEAGLGDALQVLIGTVGLTANALTGLLDVFGGLNEKLGGTPGKILAIVAAWKLLRLATRKGLGALGLEAAAFTPRALAARAGGVGALSPFSAPGTVAPNVLAASARGGLYGSATRQSLSIAQGGSNVFRSGVSRTVAGATAAGLGAASGRGLPLLRSTGVPVALIATLGLQAKREEAVGRIEAALDGERTQIEAALEEGKTLEEAVSSLPAIEPTSGWDEALQQAGRYNPLTNPIEGLAKGFESFGALIAAPGILAMGGSPRDTFDQVIETEAEERERRRREMIDQLDAEKERDDQKRVLDLFDEDTAIEKERREKILEYLSGTADEELLQEAIAEYRADPSDENLQGVITQITGAARMDPELAVLIAEAESTTDAVKDATNAYAEIMTQRARNTAEELRHQSESGRGGSRELASMLRAQARDLYANVITPLLGQDDEQSQELLAEYLDEYNGLIEEASSKILGLLDTPVADYIRETFGTSGDELGSGIARLRRLREETRKGMIDPKTSAGEQFSIAQDIIATQQEILQQRIDEATSTAEKLAIAREGIEIPPEARAALVDAQLLEGEAAETIGSISTELELGVQYVHDQIAKFLVEEKDTGIRILRTALLGKIREQDIIIDSYAAYNNFGKDLGDNSPLLAAAIEERNRLLESLMGLDAILGEGGVDVPGRQQGEVEAPKTGADREQIAELERQQAEENQKIAQEEARNAIEHRKIAARNDPVALAKLQKEAALLDLQIALEMGDRIAQSQARLAIAQADAAIQDAAQNLAQEEARNAIEHRKIAARNDPVALARLQKEAAQLDLRVALEMGDKIAQSQALLAIAQADAAIQDALREAQRNRLAGEVAIARARANGDPLAEANIGVWEANAKAALAEGDEVAQALAEQIEASNRVQDAMQDIQRAQLELAQARAQGDPVQAARIGIQIANYNLATAKGEADRLRAMIGQMDAQRALQQAIVDVFNAWNDVAVAQREAAGDTIGAAQLELERIRNNLQAARKSGDKVGELGLRAEEIRAEANLRDVRMSEAQEGIDFALEMGRITTAQAIAQLELLMQTPGITQDMIRDLQLKIKQLKDDLGQDYQMNLPTELGLPTLYEVRRTNQSGGDYESGRGILGESRNQVEDNRQYNFVINANGADAKEAVRAVKEAIQAPVTTGPRGLGF